ncbi:uncharacterized protein TA19275 [Theileria annulata]|uniref:Uncharacterized protein n=1 Tax=Theileria annulata TaxID=5874 RepID=Q4UGC9_THEAN|nr:uncharacterized protein TA19275 [Theileria annulata]CAI73860.1 hypothetical protein TA19275 [Theileria annulata]|eukprot:XP_954537.1 hypothetical protein TA19275 [Theileria annulata]
MNCFYTFLFLFALLKPFFCQAKIFLRPCILNVTGNNDRTRIDVDEQDASVTIFTPINDAEVIEVVFGPQIIWRRAKDTALLRLLAYKAGDTYSYLQIFYSKGRKVYAQTMVNDGTKLINSSTFRLPGKDTTELFGDLNLNQRSTEENPYEMPEEKPQESIQNEPHYADIIVLPPRTTEFEEEISEPGSPTTKTKSSIKTKLKRFGRYLKSLVTKKLKRKGSSNSNTDSEGQTSDENIPIYAKVIKPPKSKYHVVYEDPAKFRLKREENEIPPELPPRPMSSIYENLPSPELPPRPLPRSVFSNAKVPETETSPPKLPPRPMPRANYSQAKQYGSSSIYVNPYENENSESSIKTRNPKRRKINFLNRRSNKNNVTESDDEEPIYSTIDLQLSKQQGEPITEENDEPTTEESNKTRINLKEGLKKALKKVKKGLPKLIKSSGEYSLEDEESEKPKIRIKKAIKNSINKVKETLSKIGNHEQIMNLVELDLAGDMEEIAKVTHFTGLDIPTTEVRIFGGNLVKRITHRFQTVWEYDPKSGPLRQVILFAKKGYHYLLHVNTKASLFEGHPRMYEDIEDQWMEISLDRFLTRLEMAAFNEIDTFYEKPPITSDSFEIPEEFMKPEESRPPVSEPESRRDSTSSTGSDSNFSVQSLSPSEIHKPGSMEPVETDDTASISGEFITEKPEESIDKIMAESPKPIEEPNINRLPNGDIIPEQESTPSTTVTPYESMTDKSSIGDTDSYVSSSLDSKNSVPYSSSGSSFERIKTPELANLPEDSSVRPLLDEEGLNLYSNDGF